MQCFCSLVIYKKNYLKNLTVRWLIENRTILRGKSMLWVYELVMVSLPPPTLPKAQITYSVKGNEHRTWTPPLCYEVDRSLKSLHAFYAKNYSVPLPPPANNSVSTPEKLCFCIGSFIYICVNKWRRHIS